MSRTAKLVLPPCIPPESCGTLIARLVEWLELKAKWIERGVAPDEFKRISNYEIYSEEM